MSALDEIFSQLSEPDPVTDMPGFFVRPLPEPEWQVWLKTVKGAADDAAEMLSMADLVRRTLCKEDGRPLLAEATPEEVLAKVGRPALRDIFDAAIKANRISAEALAEEKKDSGEKADLVPAANGSGSS